MDEKMIDGILHYWDANRQAWVPFTLQSLSAAFIAMRNAYEKEKKRSSNQDELLERVRVALGGGA